MTRAEQNQPRRPMGCHCLFEFAAHWVRSDPRWSIIGIIRWINQKCGALELGGAPAVRSAERLGYGQEELAPLQSSVSLT